MAVLVTLTGGAGGLSSSLAKYKLLMAKSVKRRKKQSWELLSEIFFILLSSVNRPFKTVAYTFLSHVALKKLYRH